MQKENKELSNLTKKGNLCKKNDNSKSCNKKETFLQRPINKYNFHVKALNELLFVSNQVTQYFSCLV